MERVFSGLRIRYDPMYIRKDKKGKACITISYEEIFKKKSSRLRQIAYFIIKPIYFLFVFPVLVYWSVRDKNIKIQYIGKETSLGKECKSLKISREEKRIVAIILYFIGVHKIYAKYIKDGPYTNMNVFEYAVKYRRNVLRNFKWSESTINVNN